MVNLTLIDVQHEDIMNNLFNNSDYSDIIFMTQDIPIYAHSKNDKRSNLKTIS
jgi:hypothetical protein